MKINRSNIFLIGFLFVYLLSFCGVTINKHFCGGELEAVSLLEPEACCEGETPDEPDDCCSNESLYVSNTTETVSNGQKITLDNESTFLQTLFTLILFDFPPVEVKHDLNDIPDKPPFLEEELVAKTMVLRI